MTSGLNGQPVPPADAKPALGEDTEAKHWADELRKSDEAVADLRASLRDLENQNFTLEETIKQSNKAIESRDTEIQRLNNLYVGGQNMDALNADYVTTQNHENLKKLEAQSDFVNRENKRLEAELVTANSNI